MVTRRGREAAVPVPVQAWRRVQAAARPSLKRLLLADTARAGFVLPQRGLARRRRAKRVSVGPMYLLDTNVVAELRKPRPHGAVRAWLRSVEEADLCVAALTSGGIRAGIEVTREQDAATAEEIEDWLDLVDGAWNVLPLEAAVFRV